MDHILKVLMNTGRSITQSSAQKTLLSHVFDKWVGIVNYVIKRDDDGAAIVIDSTLRRELYDLVCQRTMSSVMTFLYEKF